MAEFPIRRRIIPLDRSIAFEIHDSAGHLIGSAKVYPDKRNPQIWTLWDAWVHPDYRGRGFQRRLIRSRINYARRHGASEIRVWVHPSNAYSLNNVVSEGFRFRAGMSRRFSGSKRRFLGLIKNLRKS